MWGWRCGGAHNKKRKRKREAGAKKKVKVVLVIVVIVVVIVLEIVSSETNASGSVPDVFLVSSGSRTSVSVRHPLMEYAPG